MLSIPTFIAIPHYSFPLNSQMLTTLSWTESIFDMHFRCHSFSPSHLPCSTFTSISFYKHCSQRRITRVSYLCVRAASNSSVLAILCKSIIHLSIIPCTVETPVSVTPLSEYPNIWTFYQPDVLLPATFMLNGLKIFLYQTLKNIN